MRKTIFTLLLSVCVMMGVQAQTLLYANDFEIGLEGSTIVGNGALVPSGHALHGRVFHNSAGGQAVRANYLLLPPTLMVDLANSGSNALTISFWVNRATATGFYWSALFSAYGAAPNPNNTWPMMVLQTRGVGQVNANGTWSDFTDAQNVKGTNTVSTAWIDAGTWKFYTAVFTPTNLKVYIDGAIMNEWQLNGTPAGGSIAGMFTAGTSMAYVCLGGNQAWNWNDPDPAFMYDRLKIYSGALTTAQINSLMATDQLSSPVLTVSASEIYLDEKFTTQTMVVNGNNLTQDITLTAPAGITVNPTFIPRNAAADVNVTVSFDGSTVSSGNISIVSGAMSRSVFVRSSLTQFVPIYSSGNMIADPTFSAATLAAGGFTGWGPTGITRANAFSGRGSAFVRGSCWPDGGSIDRPLTAANGNELKPNTTYRLRARLNIKANPDRFFQFQIEGFNGTASLFFPLRSTPGWVQFDTTFTTGATVTVGRGIYFNSCSSASPALTDTAYIDNYELYEVPIGTNIQQPKVQHNKVYLLNQRIVSEFNLNSPAEVTLSVYDMRGKMLLKSNRHFNRGLNSLHLENLLPNGIYIVKLHSVEFKLTNKLFVP